MARLTGASFLAELEREFELSAIEQALAEACARAIDRARKTGSARDARAEDRLIGELTRTLLMRSATEDDQPAMNRSTAARALAMRRWGNA